MSLLKADSRRNCTCELSVLNHNGQPQVEYSKYGNFTSSHPADFKCGLVLTFGTKTNIFRTVECIFGSSFSSPISIDKKVFISAFAVEGDLSKDKGYCIEIKVKNGKTNVNDNTLQLKCGIGQEISSRSPVFITTTHATSIDVTTSTATSTIIVTSTLITQTVAATKVVTTSTSGRTIQLQKSSQDSITTLSFEISQFDVTTVTNINTSKDKPVTQKSRNNEGSGSVVISVSVGAASGGVVVIIVVIVVSVCVIRRNHLKTEGRPSHHEDEDHDDYDMRGNILYEPSTPNNATEMVQHNAENSQRKSTSIDGDYSTVDLEDLPSVSERIRDYSSTELDKEPSSTLIHQTEFKITKPIIAPKPKPEEIREDYIYSVPDKRKDKHVAASIKNESEYAVVDKASKIRSSDTNDNKLGDSQINQSNLYAVVVKKKRISDGN
ncbi:unnamed protein product [Mytilus coruscus]|uniref:Uncharacterized protein n=1 Tax=Mytilus coruscus TaxID=42192 RepID=A0A6J8A4P5_MYTCO|nr:unnamed protein product [Mytilus coruscus]